MLGYELGLPDLVTEWRSVAERMQTFGVIEAARTLQHCADELEQALRSIEEAPLTLAEAAKLSGYSTDHLGRLVRDGKIPNAGRAGAPRIARGHVPMKSGTVASTAPASELCRKQIVRSAIDEGAA